MSYCRFRNTLADLEDCTRFMEENSNVVYDFLDGHPLPEAPEGDDSDNESEDDELLRDDDEMRAMRDLVCLCEDVVRGFSVDYELAGIERVNPNATQPG